jgi:nicotinamidase-related amidase
MKGFFFLDVDTQRDLMLREGKLSVPGAERLIPKLRRLFDFAKANGVTIISPVMTNAEDDAGFQGKPFPCVRGTDGQRKIDDTLFLHPLILENKPLDRSFADLVKKHLQIIVEKPAFDVFGNPAFEKLLRVLPQRAIIFGVPLEHSVQIAALGLRRLGCKAAVIQDAVLPLDPRKGPRAEADMRNAGVEFIDLELLLGSLAAI